MKKVLVLGHNGMLGNAVNQYLHDKCIVETNPYRWDSINFRNLLLSSDAKYVINCIGAIPQKKHVDKYYLDVNYNLPIFLETTGKRIIHPSTDCEFYGDILYPNKYDKNHVADADDGYGITKAKATKEIVNNFKNTKIIRTSIIGHEITEKKYSLLDWFLSVEDGSTVNGYSNHYWNGITTLSWAEIAYNMINDWDRYDVLTQVGLDGLSKYELLKIFNDVYNKTVIVNSFNTEKSVNKMLKSDFTFSDDIRESLIKLKQFYNK